MVEQTNQKQQELTDADLEKIEQNMKNMKNLEQQIKNEEGKCSKAAQTPLAGKNGTPAAAAAEDDSYEEGELQPGEEGAEIKDNPDERSVFVKNVDFSIGEDQLAEHFKECGPIERITIRKNPQTGQSIG